MRSVGIKTLKDRLSEYIRLVQSGETVLVTDRDRVVAELIPPRDGRSLSVHDAVLADLLRTGLITPPAIVGAGPPPRIPALPIAEILHDLDLDRSDR